MRTSCIQGMAHSGIYDSIVVGSGPNGLAAAIALARSGLSVCVMEEAEDPGGCVRSDGGTLDGYVHDTCAAIFSMAVDTPFFSTLSGDGNPIDWIVPPAALAHPFDDGSCVKICMSLEATMESLGADAGAYERFIRPFIGTWWSLAAEVLRPPVHVPRSPLLFLRFGLRGLWPVSVTAGRLFRTGKARALLAGLGAHSIMPLTYPLTSAFALLMCASAHGTGWPIPRGGAGAITDVLVSHLQSLGTEIVLSHPVHDLKGLPESRTLFFDLTPRQILSIAHGRIPQIQQARLSRYSYGPGVFKLDWALDGPIPWKAKECSDAATVHLGGSYEEIALSEHRVGQGMHSERPFVICVQPSLFDPSRAPAGRHVAWAYCHVPGGSGVDMTERIEGQIERFAPGFRKRILCRRVLSPDRLERLNANLVGGDITGGANTLMQLLFRPVLPMSLNPYELSGEGLYICSSSSPPGGGVHGMCGYNASRTALKEWGAWRPGP